MRMFSWPARYAPFVEEHLRMCERIITTDLRCRGEERAPVVDAALIDTALEGRITVAVLPDAALNGAPATEVRNARIAALVTRPDFALREQFMAGRGDVRLIGSAGGFSVLRETPAECIDALLDAQERGEFVTAEETTTTAARTE